MFEVWDEHGYATGLTLQALKVRISNDYQGESDGALQQQAGDSPRPSF